MAERRAHVRVGRRLAQVLTVAGAALSAVLFVAISGSEVAYAQSNPPPGTSIGVLDLDAYCQSLGHARSQVEGPIVGPNAAYTWNCVTSTEGLTPVNLQGACSFSYPNAGSVAYPQDVNDAHSWICVVPTTGVRTSAGTTTASFASPAGSAIAVVAPGGWSVSARVAAADVLVFGGGESAMPVFLFEGFGGILTP